MGQRKVKVTTPAGKVAEGTEMDVDESVERWSEFTFPDGSLMRIKVSLPQVTRIDGEFDPEGNPLYMLKMMPTAVLISAGAGLKKKTQ